MDVTLNAAPASPLAAATDAARWGEAAWDGQTLLRIRRQLAQAAQFSTRDEVLTAVSGLLRSLQAWDYLAVVTVGQGGGQPQLEGIVSPTAGLARSLQEQLLASGRQAITEQRTTTHRAQEPAAWIVATPGPRLPVAEPMALVAVSSQAAALKPPSLLVLECAANEIAQAEVRQRLAESEQHLARTAAVVELIERLSQAGTPEQLDQLLAREVAAMFPGSQVALGRRSGRNATCRLVAAAGERTAKDDDALPGLMDEVLMQRRLTQWPAESPTAEAGLLLHRQYVETQADAWLVGLPMIESDSDGVVLLIVGREGAGPSAAASFLHAAGPPITSIRETVRLAQLGPLTRWRRSLGRALSKRRAWAWGGAATLAGLAMAVPVPHRVECDCDLEPVVRQFVAAPFDAPLEAVLVRPGDEVQADQVLARLDGRELRWELAGVAADHQRASRERDGHMAVYDSGAARLSELEMERLQLRKSLLDHRTTQLEIRSPVSGLVITGELEQVIGAPLETGQTLFELAPVEQLTAELKVSERDVPYTHVGQPVQFWLDSQPDEPRTGVITRIAPRAELHAGASVFVAEVAVANHEGWLRPGMHGTARIDVGDCRLGWRLFHRAWEETRVAIGF